jgi:hypothetical protein
MAKQTQPQSTMRTRAKKATPSTVKKTARAIKRKGPKEKKTLHFDLTHFEGHDDFTLHAGGRKLKLRPHTYETRQAARSQSKLLALIPPERLTHHVPDVELPANRPMMIFVTSSRRLEGEQLDPLALTHIHVPTTARKKILSQRWERDVAADQPPRPHPKLEYYGIKAPSAGSSSKEHIDYRKLVEEAHLIQGAFDAAHTLVFHHPELASLDPNIAGKVMNYIEYAPGISDLAHSIYEQAHDYAQGESKENWVNSRPATGIDLKTPSGTDTYQWSQKTEGAVATPGLPGPLTATLQHTKNDPELQNWSYVVQKGTTSVGGPNQGPSPMHMKFKRPSPRMMPTALEESTSNLMARDVTPNSGVEYSEVSLENGNFKISVTNEWIRWLSLYAEFVGTDGVTPIEPQDWKTKLISDKLSSTFESATKKYLALSAARDTILGIPLDASPTEISFPWPSNNPSGVRILCGGLGVLNTALNGRTVGNWDTQVCTVGAILTGVLNMALPTFFLVAGAAMTWSEDMDEDIKESLEVFLTALRGFIEGPVASSLAGGEIKILLAALANCAIDLLLKELTKVWEELLVEIGTEEALDAVPFAGWVAEAINIAADAALLVQTTVEVLSSYATIEIDVNKVMDVTMTVLPDPQSASGQQWPAQSDHYVALLQYSDGTTYQQTAHLDPVKTTGPIRLTFSNVPAGGSVRAVFSVYSDTDWLCGKGQTNYLPAPVDGGTMQIPPAGSDFAITQMLAPLDANTLYEYKAKLVYDTTHHWGEPPQYPAPTATGPLDKSPIGSHLTQLVDITFSQLTGALGYVWQGSGVDLHNCAGGSSPSLPFTFQNITVLPQGNNGEQVVQAPPCGLAEQPYLVYDLLGPRSGDGANFYYDPRNGGNHLRQVILDGKTPFNLNSGQSWGCFNEQMDSMAIHPAGFVVGINNANNKLEILPLLSASVPDSAAPLAQLKGGLGSRPGLLHSPLACVATADGRILVLDQAFTSPDLTAPARIQALDIHANPVSCFAGGSSPEMALKPESALVTYLDMGVESKGYIYVLKVVGDLKDPENYKLDVYKPDGTFLFQTAGVAAGKMTVSLWRDVYTLNYEVLAGPCGTEPSVSWWSPSSPS